MYHDITWIWTQLESLFILEPYNGLFYGISGIVLTFYGTLLNDD